MKRPEEEAEEVEEVVVRSVLADRPKFFKRFEHTRLKTRKRPSRGRTEPEEPEDLAGSD